MPDVPAAVHSKIVNELEAARHEFIAARDTTEASRGYMGFALADETLLECVAAIEQLTDRAQITCSSAPTTRRCRRMGPLVQP
jgi:hypothetical protein